MKTLYTTRVTATGGRQGRVCSEDGLLDLPLALPAALGGKGGATNPEQLFAAGYAACFGNAIIHLTRNRNDRIRDEDVAVDARVSLVPDGKGGFVLAVALDVTLTGVDQDQAETILAEAHRICPYSNAVHGNIDVRLSVSTH